MREMIKYIAPKVLAVMRTVEEPVTKKENRRLKLTPKQEKILDWYCEKYLGVKRNPIKTKHRIKWEPAPCRCTDETICGFCVLANQFLWEKDQKKETIPLPNLILQRVRKTGVRKTSRLLGVEHNTVMRWLKKRKIPDTYREKLYNIWGKGDATLPTPPK